MSNAGLSNNGEGGIRTPEPLRVTRFPSARTRPTMRPLRNKIIRSSIEDYTQFTAGFPDILGVRHK